MATEYYFQDVWPNGKIYRRIGFNSTIDASVGSLTGTFACGWNGTDIHYTSDVNVLARKAIRGTGFTGTIQSSFNFPVVGSDIYDMKFDASGNVYLVSASTTKAYKMTGFSSTINASVTMAEALRGVTMDSSGNVFLGTNAASVKAYKLAGFTSTITTSVSGFPNQGTTGCSIDNNGNFISGGNVAAKHFQYTGFSTSVAASFAWVSGTTSQNGSDWWSQASAASGPANLKTYNTNVKANIKTISTNAIANVKTLSTNV